MATRTLGTNANNTLTAVLYNVGTLSDADMATIQQSILDDINVAHPTFPGAFAKNGLLYVPNRGVLKVLAGDFIGVDSRGWPILVSADAIANGPWTHT